MKSIFKNLISLFLIQGLGLLIPLILTPYIIQVLGVSLYGVVATAQSAAIIFALLTEFGFNITAVRRISQHKQDPAHVNQVVNDVFFLKLFLLSGTLLLFAAVIWLVPHFRVHAQLFLLSYAMVAGQALIPYWYFQGTEDLNKTVIPVSAGKLLSIALIFWLVKQPKDALLVNLIFGLTSVFSGIWLHILIYRKHRLSLKQVNRKTLWNELLGGLPIFLANIGVVAFANSTILILSFFVQPYLLGIYSIADRIIQLFRSLLILFHQVTYPRLCALIQEGNRKTMHFLKQTYGGIWLLVFTGCLILLTGAPYIILYFIKDPGALPTGIRILRQMSFICLIVSLNMPFYQLLLAYRNDWLTARVHIPAALVSLLLNLILVPFIGIAGSVITVYLIEASVTTLFVYFAIPYIRQLLKRIQGISSE